MKMKNWAVAMVFMVAPFAFLAPGLIWKSQLLWFLICPIFIIALNLRNVWIKAFLVYAAIWQIFIFLMAFNHPEHNAGPGLTILLALMAGAIIFKYVSEGSLSDDTWFMLIRIAVIMQILIATPQHFLVNPMVYFLRMFTKIAEKQPGHLVGTLGNRNYLSAFIGYATPFFIGWRTFKVKGITINPALICIVVFLFFCFSPATLAVTMGLLFIYTYDFALKTKAMILLGGMVLCAGYVAFYVVGPGTYYAYERGSHLWEFQALPGQLKELWTTGTLQIDPNQGDLGRFGMILSAFSQMIHSWNIAIFGYGPAASWGRKYPIHCEYMSMWFQFGLIGLGLLAGYIVTTFRYLAKRKDLVFMGSFLIICIDMVGNFPAGIATTAFMMIVICGLIERKRINE